MFDRFLADMPGYQSNIEKYEDDGQRIVMRVHGINSAPRTGLGIEVVFTQTWDYEDGVFKVRERLVESESGLTDLLSPSGRDD
jgi:hypothetical protein